MSDYNDADVRVWHIGFMNGANEFEYYEKLCTPAEFQAMCKEIMIPDGTTYAWGWATGVNKATIEQLARFGWKPR
jgi:hypothetical protein